MDDLAQLAYDESARLKQLAFHNAYHSDRWTPSRPRTFSSRGRMLEYLSLSK